MTREEFMHLAEDLEDTSASKKAAASLMAEVFTGKSQVQEVSSSDPLWIKVLSHRNPAIRTGAVFWLYHQAGADCADLLLKALEHEREEQITCYILTCLKACAMSGDCTANSLSLMAKTSRELLVTSSVTVLCRVAEILSILSSSEGDLVFAGERLKAHLQSKDPLASGEKTLCISALGKIQKESATLRLMSQDRDPCVRACSAMWLFKNGDDGSNTALAVLMDLRANIDSIPEAKRRQVATFLRDAGVTSST